MMQVRSALAKVQSVDFTIFITDYCVGALCMSSILGYVMERMLQLCFLSAFQFGGVSLGLNLLFVGDPG